MSFGASEAERREPDILLRIRENDRRRRLGFRLQFALVWAAILAALIGFIAGTIGFNTELIGTYLGFILGGVPITMTLAVLAVALAVFLAVLGALGRISRLPILYAIATFYVSLVRGTPLLLQILFVYLALPQAGIVIDGYWTAVIALGFNYGAYMTEIFRAGIEAVPTGQYEAARSLGMTERLTMRRIVLPQAVRIITPAIGNEFIAMMKDTALASTIAVQELLWRAQTVGRPRFQSMQTLLIAALIYWILTIVFSLFQDRLEKRMAAGDRRR